MNVLNQTNGKFGFSSGELKRGLAAMVPVVAEGGLLLIGRTVRSADGVFATNATLFEKIGGRLERQRCFGAGTELEAFLIPTQR